jgi:hypothetical protein
MSGEKDFSIIKKGTKESENSWRRKDFPVIPDSVDPMYNIL